MGSPGVEKLRFLKPLRPGDTVSMRLRVRVLDPSKSRPNLGRVTYAFELTNQREELILDYASTSLMGRRPAA